MSAYAILAAAGLVSVVIAIGYVLAGSPKIGSATLAAALAAGFAAFTAVTIAREGVLLVWTNHTENLWGVQVWWDLLFAVGIAVFLIAPRARAAGMNLVPWLLFVAATASIGLLAMVARLFWLEARTEA
ncbi:hypothetical protein [Qipengyuania gaetbuli]|uniref:hypothetical protein n=1 Tax=Qipengyuania gaetbuli TaxID=266952 RepID=UPI0028F728C0|nr:hypothetical protein [Qipengyuania gaetbuli]